MFDIRLLDKTWLMEPTTCAAFHRRLATLDHWPTPMEVDSYREAAASKALRKTAKGGIAVLEIHGMIEPRLSMMSMLFGGGFSIESGSEILDQLVSARDIGAIALHFDTPGGLSDSVEEFADQIFEARAKKPIHSIADTTAASAGFWLATQANSFSITPSGLTGSLGVYTSHVSFEKQLAEDGIEVTTVASDGAPHKVEMSPYKNLTPEARQHMQELVNDTHERFVSAVARGRGVQPSVVRTKFGRGRVLTSTQAVEVGAADRVISFREFLGKLQTGNPSNGAARAATAEVLRLRHQQRKRVAAC